MIDRVKVGDGTVHLIQDSTVDGKISTAVSTEATARASADSSLSSRITALESKGLFVTNQQLRFG